MTVPNFFSSFFSSAFTDAGKQPLDAWYFFDPANAGAVRSVSVIKLIMNLCILSRPRSIVYCVDKPS